MRITKDLADITTIWQGYCTRSNTAKLNYRRLSFTFTGVYQTCELNRSKMVHRIVSNENIFKSSIIYLLNEIKFDLI